MFVTLFTNFLNSDLLEFNFLEFVKSILRTDNLAKTIQKFNIQTTWVIPGLNVTANIVE